MTPDFFSGDPIKRDKPMTHSAPLPFLGLALRFWHRFPMGKNIKHRIPVKMLGWFQGKFVAKIYHLFQWIKCRHGAGSPRHGWVSPPKMTWKQLDDMNCHGWMLLVCGSRENFRASKCKLGHSTYSPLDWSRGYTNLAWGWDWWDNPQAGENILTIPNPTRALHRDEHQICSKIANNSRRKQISIH